MTATFPEGVFPEITARGWRGEPITVRTGDTVRFKRPDGQVRTDVVRQAFYAYVLVEPYGPNYAEPAVVLTEHSWTPVSRIYAVSPAGGGPR